MIAPLMLILGCVFAAFMAGFSAGKSDGVNEPLCTMESGNGFWNRKKAEIPCPPAATPKEPTA